MKRFVEGADRGQSTLLPECLDEWVEESNSVRVACVAIGHGFEAVKKISAAGLFGPQWPNSNLKLAVGYFEGVQ